MRIAILSDIHANMEALAAVLDDLDQLSVDSIYSLGDNVGYGAEPQAVLEELSRRGIVSVMGNHELGLASRRSREKDFNPHARQALEVTRTLLSDAAIRELAGFPRYLVVHGARLVHGCPPDSPTRYLYMVDEGEFLSRFKSYPEQVCFAGHTHELGLVVLEGGSVRRLPLPQGVTSVGSFERAIVNAGSVGQPRDGDNRAKYLVWDTQAASVEVRFVAYDIASCAAKIEQSGMARRYADRLWSGT